MNRGYFKVVGLRSLFHHYLPWTRPLNTWLLPARVASHSMEDKAICDSEITTCFMSGRRMGSSSTHCFASMASCTLIYTDNRYLKSHYKIIWWCSCQSSSSHFLNFDDVKQALFLWKQLDYWKHITNILQNYNKK